MCEMAFTEDVIIVYSFFVCFFRLYTLIMKTYLTEVQVSTSYIFTHSLQVWKAPDHLGKAAPSHIKPSTVFTGSLLQSQAVEMLYMINFRNVTFS